MIINIDTAGKKGPVEITLSRFGAMRLQKFILDVTGETTIPTGEDEITEAKALCLALYEIGVSYEAL